MTKNIINLQDLAHRLEKLEINKSKRNLIGLLLAIIIIMTGFSFSIPLASKEIVAEKIILVDNHGRTRVKMELENGNPKITLNYENGDPSLHISGEELCFYDQGRKARINIKGKDTLNSSCISLTDHAGKRSVNLSAGPEGPYLSIEDNEEQKEVVLSIDSIGSLNLIERNAGERLPPGNVMSPPRNDSQVKLQE
jgi:hypothetical protein